MASPEKGVLAVPRARFPRLSSTALTSAVSHDCGLGVPLPVDGISHSGIVALRSRDLLLGNVVGDDLDKFLIFKERHVSDNF